MNDSVGVLYLCPPENSLEDLERLEGSGRECGGRVGPSETDRGCALRKGVRQTYEGTPTRIGDEVRGSVHSGRVRCISTSVLGFLRQGDYPSKSRHLSQTESVTHASGGYLSVPVLSRVLFPFDRRRRREQT